MRLSQHALSKLECYQSLGLTISAILGLVEARVLAWRAVDI